MEDRSSICYAVMLLAHHPKPFIRDIAAILFSFSCHDWDEVSAITTDECWISFKQRNDHTFFGDFWLFQVNLKGKVLLPLHVQLTLLLLIA